MYFWMHHRDLKYAKKKTSSPDNGRGSEGRYIFGNPEAICSSSVVYSSNTKGRAAIIRIDIDSYMCGLDASPDGRHLTRVMGSFPVYHGCVK